MRYRITTHYEFSGATLYALLFDGDNNCWNGTAFVAFTGDNSTFDIPLTEDANRTGFYTAVIDADIPPGAYDEEIFEQAGASPDRTTDDKTGVQVIHWCGGVHFPMEHIAMGAMAGTIRKPYRLETGHGVPIPGVFVTVCTDEDGRYPIAADVSDYEGICDFWLRPGTYYFFRRKAGMDFVNPDIEVVTTP
jgi:hypothetical protein